VTDRPGSGGPWPVDPQVPSSEQPPGPPMYPIPSQPNVPPQQPAFPANGPTLVSASQTYQAQPHGGQPSLGQGYESPPWMGPPLQGGTEDIGPDVVPAKYGVMAIVAILVIAVVGVGVAVWSVAATPKLTAAAVWTPDPTVRPTVAAMPNASPSASSVGNCTGSVARAPGWSATVPSGWSCLWVNGREIYIEDTRGDTIEVSVTKVSPAAACSTNLLQGTASVMALPDTTWGGRVSKTANFKDQVWNGQVRCASMGSTTYVMLGLAYSGALGNVVTAEDSLAQSWVWKV
jgi:hypothetical protein